MHVVFTKKLWSTAEMKSPQMPVGLLLAAGHSRRFGDADKLLQRLPEGELLAVVSARHLRQVVVNCVAVVRTHNTLLAETLTNMGYVVVLADNQYVNMGDSLQLGLTSIVERWPQCCGVLVALADMPSIQPTTYHQVVDAMLAGAPIVRPHYRGQPGHPVAFAASVLPALRQVTGDQGARALLQAHAADLLQLQLDDAGVVHDIDTPQQLSAFRSGHRLP